MDSRQPSPCCPSPPFSHTVFPASPSCCSQVWVPLPEGVPARGWAQGEAEPSLVSAGRCWLRGMRGSSGSQRIKRIYREIRHSAELPWVIVPRTIRGCAGNFGAADRYRALIQLSLQPLLAKIRGNWYYKWFLGKCWAPVLNDLPAIIHT